MTEKAALHRLFPVRQRYIFTRQNKLRLRYVLSIMVCVSFTAVTGLGYSGISVAYAPNDHVIASVDDAAGVEHTYFDVEHVDEIEVSDADILDVTEQDDVSSEDVLEQPEEVAISWPQDKTLTMASGDTVAGMLQDVGVSGAESYRAIKAVSKLFDPRNVRAGQSFDVTLDNGENGLELTGLRMKLDSVREIIVSKDEQDRYSADLHKKKLILQKKAAKAKIESSLFGSAAKAGIPNTVTANMMRIYSYEVDFQRDIRQGDEVEILYEVYETEDGEFAKYGDILYANLAVAGDDKSVFRYQRNDGSSDYYQEDGRSMKRALMRTPVDGARISSGFGMRRHPVLGYNKMHKGMDFAAPTGTPIFAAGDGVIEKAGRNGGYGNYVRIRHTGEMKTAYAHMNKFAKGIKRGTRVKQGQVIGYVGTTGRSTGPHLHFEVLKNNKHINPKSIKSSPGERLAGTRLKEFQSQMQDIRQDFASLARGLKYAKAENTQ